MGRACGTRPTAFTTTDSSRRASRIRSIVGIIPLFAVEVIADEVLYKLHGFRKRMEWFLNHRRDLARQISYLEEEHADGSKHSHRLLAIPSREQLERVLRYVLDESEFLSPHGVRALPRFHADHPRSFWCGDEKHRVEYVPGESASWLFGGNSNWREPEWFPVNYLLIEALERYHHFYGDSFQIEARPDRGSG